MDYQKVFRHFETEHGLTLLNSEMDDIEHLFRDSRQAYIVNTSNHALPNYETYQSAGMDLRAYLKAPVTLAPMERRLIPTGLRIELPTGYEAQIRSRSGLALKRGLVVANGVGTIDADYRGDIGIILCNISNEPQTVENGDRLAQMVVNAVTRLQWVEMENLTNTTRGTGGFGSTGVK